MYKMKLLGKYKLKMGPYELADRLHRIIFTALGEGAQGTVQELRELLEEVKPKPYKGSVKKRKPEGLGGGLFEWRLYDEKAFYHSVVGGRLAFLGHFHR